MRRYFSMLARWTAVLGVLVSAACVPDKPLDLVEDAVDELGRQPGRWREVVGGTITDLGKMGSELAADVRAEVEALYSRALGQTESAAFCGEEFIGTRIRQRLQAILHEFDSRKPEPEIVPVVCLTEPIEIVSGQRPIVHYYGFDFLEFEKEHDFTADIQYADNGETAFAMQSGPYIDVGSNYHLAVDFQSFDIASLDRARGPQLVLKWGGNDVERSGRESALVILVPTPIPPPTPIPTRVITVEGHADITDDDWPDSDDHGQLIIPAQNVVLSPYTSAPLQFSKCVGGEVRLDLNIVISLHEDMKADANIEAQFFEGTSCSTDDREERKTALVYAIPGGPPATWTYTLRNTEDNGGDWAAVTLTFTNRAP